MSGGSLLGLLVILLVVWLVFRAQWSLHRYPQIACQRCHGAGWRTAWIWHLQSMRPRKVRGPCTKCGGTPWSDRRG